MTFKKVMTLDSREHKLRLFRFMWRRGRWGEGGYSAQLSVALMPVIYAIQRRRDDVRIVVCGLSIHWQRSFGGYYV